MKPRVEISYDIVFKASHETIYCKQGSRLLVSLFWPSLNKWLLIYKGQNFF